MTGVEGAALPAGFVRIEDPDDVRVADYRSLTDVALRRRTEPEHGMFIAEGELVVRRALAAGYPPRSLLVAANRVAELAELAAALPPGCPRYAAGLDVLGALTGFHVHRGVLAAMGRRRVPEVSELLADARRVAILEEINNPTNLGALFRCAAGLGVDAVLLAPTCADPLYRRSVRVSMGEVFAVPFARLHPWPDGLARLREDGWRLLALTPDPSAVSLDAVHADPDERVGVLLGAEGPGLSAPVLDLAEECVRIPMARGVDSLNVAVAAAMAFWQLRR